MDEATILGRVANSSARLFCSLSPAFRLRYSRAIAMKYQAIAFHLNETTTNAF